MAEPRLTTESVTLRKKPGEKEPAIVTIPAHTEVTVLGEEGRWLKIKVNGAIGYVTRTTISGTSKEPPAETSEGWSSKRKGDELFIDVPVAGALVSEPKPSAAKVADLAKGAHLSVIDTTTPNWIHARDEQGHEGWIARSLVENGATTVQVGGNVDLQGTAALYSRPPLRPLVIRAQLGLGYRALGMDMSSNVDGGLSNFLVDADAAAFGLDGDARYAIGGNYFVGADLRIGVSRSSPGIDFNEPNLEPGKIPFTTVAGDLGVHAGVRVRDAFDLALRAGGHYDAFLVTANDPMNPANASNAANLPSERLVGATVGARAELLPPRSRFEAGLRFDVMVVGSRAQTPGYRDGTSSSAHALWGGVIVRYQLAAHIAPFLSYDFGHLTTSWTGKSEREPSVTSANRTDTTQLVQLGVTAEL